MHVSGFEEHASSMVVSTPRMRSAWRMTVQVLSISMQSDVE